MTNILAKTILKEMQEEIKATGNLTKDVEALELAIKALEGNALEVPVQEQLYNQHMKEKKVIKNVCIIMFLLVCVSIYLSFKFIN